MGFTRDLHLILSFVAQIQSKFLGLKRQNFSKRCRPTIFLGRSYKTKQDLKIISFTEK